MRAGFPKASNVEACVEPPGQAGLEVCHRDVDQCALFNDKAEKADVKVKLEPGAGSKTKNAWATEINAFMAYFEFDVTALSAEAGHQGFEFLGTAPRFNDTLGIMKSTLAETSMDFEKHMDALKPTPRNTRSD